MTIAAFVLSIIATVGAAISGIAALRANRIAGRAVEIEERRELREGRPALQFTLKSEPAVGEDLHWLSVTNGGLRRVERVHLSFAEDELLSARFFDAQAMNPVDFSREWVLWDLGPGTGRAVGLRWPRMGRTQGTLLVHVETGDPSDEWNERRDLVRPESVDGNADGANP